MAITLTDTNNYIGQLFDLGGGDNDPIAPFFFMIRNNLRRSTSRTFSMGVKRELSNASMSAVSETVASGSFTPMTQERTQNIGYAQIQYSPVEVGLIAQSEIGLRGGINIDGSTEIRDILSEQRESALMQMDIDVDYAFINGTEVAPATPATVGATKGIINASSSNVDAAGGVLTMNMLESLYKMKVDASGRFNNDSVMLCNTTRLLEISKLYGFQPASVLQGGVNIQRIVTPFGILRVEYEPHMPDAALQLVDLGACAPVIMPLQTSRFSKYVNLENITDINAGVDAGWVEKDSVGAAIGGYIMLVVGLDYTDGKYHANITDLAV